MIFNILKDHPKILKRIRQNFEVLLKITLKKAFDEDSLNLIMTQLMEQSKKNTIPTTQ